MARLLFKTVGYFIQQIKSLSRIKNVLLVKLFICGVIIIIIGFKLTVDIHIVAPISSTVSGSNWNLERVGVCGEGKPEYPEKNLLEQRREPTTNSTHI